MVLAVSLALAAVACSPSKADVAAQQRDACFQNQAQIKTAINLVHADSGLYADVADVVKQLHLACPAGGTYSFDQNSDTVSCSVHGTTPPNWGK